MEKNVPITKQVANFISNDKQTNSFGRIKKKRTQNRTLPMPISQVHVGFVLYFFYISIQ